MNELVLVGDHLECAAHGDTVIGSRRKDACAVCGASVCPDCNDTPRLGMRWITNDVGSRMLEVCTHDS